MAIKKVGGRSHFKNFDVVVIVAAVDGVVFTLLPSFLPSSL